MDAYQSQSVPGRSAVHSPTMTWELLDATPGPRCRRCQTAGRQTSVGTDNPRGAGLRSGI